MQNEDIIIKGILELHEKFDRLAPLPARLDGFEDRMTTILDGHTRSLERLEQERVFSMSRFERIEGDITAIKSHLGMRSTI